MEHRFSFKFLEGLAFAPFCTVLIIIEIYTCGCFELVFFFVSPTHSLPLFGEGCDASFSPVCNVRSLASFYSTKSSTECYPSIIECFFSSVFVHCAFPVCLKKNATAVLLDVEMPNKETLMPACVVSLVGSRVCAIDIICLSHEKGIGHLPLVCHTLISRCEDCVSYRQRQSYQATTDGFPRINGLFSLRNFLSRVSSLKSLSYKCNYCIYTAVNEACRCFNVYAYIKGATVTKSR